MNKWGGSSGTDTAWLCQPLSGPMSQCGRYTPVLLESMEADARFVMHWVLAPVRSRPIIDNIFILFKIIISSKFLKKYSTYIVYINLPKLNIIFKVEILLKSMFCFIFYNIFYTFIYRLSSCLFWILLYSCLEAKNKNQILFFFWTKK